MKIMIGVEAEGDRFLWEGASVSSFVVFAVSVASLRQFCGICPLLREL